METEVPLTARLWFLSAAEWIQSTLPYSVSLRSVLDLSCYSTNTVLLYEVRHQGSLSLCHAFFPPSLRQWLRLDVRIVSLCYNMTLCSQNRRSRVITGNILNYIFPHLFITKQVYHIYNQPVVNRLFKSIYHLPNHTQANRLHRACDHYHRHGI